MASIGYARVSTHDQNLDLQRDALNAAGCSTVFEDKISGAKSDRPGLADALGYVRDGDVLMVWKLDRLGRSMSHLIKSLTEQIDTTTASGRLIFHVFASLGQFERDLNRERTQAGLKAAEARGRKGGRKRVLTDEKLAKAKSHIAKGLTVREAASRVKVGKTVLYSMLSDKKS